MGGKHKNYKLGYFQKNLKRLEQHTHTEEKLTMLRKLQGRIL